MTEPIRYVKDEKPDFVGPFGEAWRRDDESYLRRYPESPKRLRVAAWIVRNPSAHPLWEYYTIVLVRLCDIPGVKPAKIHLEGATHEIFVIALDPDKSPTINSKQTYLHPINYAGQWIAGSDDEAEKKVLAAVMDILEGNLSPDTDFRWMWIARFGNSNIKK